MQLSGRVRLQRVSALQSRLLKRGRAPTSPLGRLNRRDEGGGRREGCGEDEQNTSAYDFSPLKKHVNITKVTIKQHIYTPHDALYTYLKTIVGAI